MDHRSDQIRSVPQLCHPLYDPLDCSPPGSLCRRGRALRNTPTDGSRAWVHRGRVRVHAHKMGQLSVILYHLTYYITMRLWKKLWGRWVVHPVMGVWILSLGLLSNFLANNGISCNYRDFFTSPSLVCPKETQWTTDPKGNLREALAWLKMGKNVGMTLRSHPDNPVFYVPSPSMGLVIFGITQPLNSHYLFLPSYFYN